MPGTRVVCKSCGGTNFKQVKVDTWKCLDCGREKRVTKGTRTISKNRPEIPKESITTGSYKPLIAYCQNCGEKIDRIGSPADQKRLNNKWANHTCTVNRSKESLYS